MGLDISYYSKVVESNDKTFEDGLFIHDSFLEYQLGSLKKLYVYDLTEKSESGSFRAGSYSGYNFWRNKLAIFAGYGSAENVWKKYNFMSNGMRYFKLKKISNEEVNIEPFVELIYFSDCEGIIGPEICKKLYEDFVKFDDEAQKVDYGYFYEKYLDWKEAFRVASDGGLVHFH